MTTRTQWKIVLAIVAALAAVLVVASMTMRTQLMPLTVGSKAPDFTARTVDGSAIKTLDNYRGEVVLVNVWATWCGPCVVEMPSMEKLHREFGPKGLKIVAISIDADGSGKVISDFAATHNLTFEILHDPAQNVSIDYQTSGVPESFLIGKDGVIRQKHHFTDWYTDAARAVVAQLLGLPAPTPVDNTVAAR